MEEEQNLKFYSILTYFTLNVKSHMWLVATIWNRTTLESLCFNLQTYFSVPDLPDLFSPLVSLLSLARLVAWSISSLVVPVDKHIDLSMLGILVLITGDKTGQSRNTNHRGVTIMERGCKREEEGGTEPEQALPCPRLSTRSWELEIWETVSRCLQPGRDDATYFHGISQLEG